MSDRIITFTKAPGDEDWKANTPEDHHYARVCNGTFAEYINLPSGKNEFEVIFSVDKPTEDHFAVIEDEDGDGNLVITLDTDDQISWYDGAIALLHDLYHEGYRYARVEY